MSDLSVLEDALYDILESSSLFIAKEIAAEALDVNVEEYLEDDRDEELDFEEDDVTNIRDILSQLD
jgi:hypothetical protein